MTIYVSIYFFNPDFKPKEASKLALNQKKDIGFWNVGKKWDQPPPKALV